MFPYVVEEGPINILRPLTAENVPAARLVRFGTLMECLCEPPPEPKLKV